ncbi:hypothetical protein [Deinococcus hopiensis]|uniref:Uncharacterized protein n=1 Tax=Deinococcus hopiensis KR-140 TaxID=695939 RepID=A0A1W1UFI7_9DEIO|nr:hypothetical protein [Deinococcus hopiensis]SMB79868.1 hypothetical protein SAMN00790413_05347 [Deinococcus hopiensis KR-140]
MAVVLIVLVLVAVAVAVMVSRSSSKRSKPSSSAPTVSDTPVQRPAAPQVTAAPSRQAAPTALADEDEQVRQEIDPRALAAARAAVTKDVPDEVLSDALQDASPTQLAHLFAAVPADVMAAAIGSGGKKGQEQARPEDLAQLRGAGNAVDDLEIWDFGKND